MVIFSSCQQNGTKPNSVKHTKQISNQDKLSNKEYDRITPPHSSDDLIYRSNITKKVGEFVDMGINEIVPHQNSNILQKGISDVYQPPVTDNPPVNEKPVRLLNITFDNDIFNNTDYYYTNGVIIELFNPIAGNTPISKILPGIKSSDINNYGFSLRQNIYTPTNPDIPEITKGDRPFSAFLTIGQVRESYNLKKRLSVTSRLNFGVLGPASLGGVVQSSIHNIEPQGWNNQINNSLVIDFSMKMEKGIISNPNVEINLIAGGNIGTVFNKINGGLYFRTGRFTPVYKGNILNTKRTLQYWFFIEGATNLVLYDATLQGGFIGSNNMYTLNNDDINRVVLSASVGFALYYHNLGLELQNFYISPEFKNAYDFRWGRIRLIFKI